MLFINKHSGNHIIKYNQYFTLFIWIVFFNIFINMKHIICIFNKGFRLHFGLPKHMWLWRFDQISKSSSAARHTGPRPAKARVTLVFRPNFKVIISCGKHWASVWQSTCNFSVSTKFPSHHQLQDTLDFGPQKHVLLWRFNETSKSSSAAGRTGLRPARALTGQSPVHPAADEDFQI